MTHGSASPSSFCGTGNLSNTRAGAKHREGRFIPLQQIAKRWIVFLKKSSGRPSSSKLIPRTWGLTPLFGLGCETAFRLAMLAQGTIRFCWSGLL